MYLQKTMSIKILFFSIILFDIFCFFITKLYKYLISFLMVFCIYFFFKLLIESTQYKENAD